MNEIFIVKLKESKETRDAVTNIFIDAYKEQLSSLSKNEKTLYRVFYQSFDLERFYGAYTNDKLIGIFAISESSKRAIRIKMKDFIKNFGLIKGIIASSIMKNEFEREIILREPGFYIEAVATLSNHQGMGVGKKMMQYAIDNYDYLELEVVDTNSPAIKLYKKLGFVLFKEIEEKGNSKSKGFSKKLYMYYKK